MSLPCARCAQPLPVENLNPAGAATCPGCHAPVIALVFPALHARPPITVPAPFSEGEASCFYHVRKKAIVPCDRCGRFLCGLCQVDWNRENWCPNCISAHRNVITRAVLYDSMALHLAVFPLLVWPFTLITGPMALYVAIRHWRSPGSLVRRSRLRIYLAAGIAVVEIIAWIWLLAFGLTRYL